MKGEGIAANNGFDACRKIDIVSACCVGCVIPLLLLFLTSIYFFFFSVIRYLVHLSLTPFLGDRPRCRETGELICSIKSKKTCACLAMLVSDSLLELQIYLSNSLQPLPRSTNRSPGFLLGCDFLQKAGTSTRPPSFHPYFLSWCSLHPIPMFTSSPRTLTRYKTRSRASS